MRLKEAKVLRVQTMTQIDVHHLSNETLQPSDLDEGNVRISIFASAGERRNLRLTTRPPPRNQELGPHLNPELDLDKTTTENCQFLPLFVPFSSSCS